VQVGDSWVEPFCGWELGREGAVIALARVTAVGSAKALAAVPFLSSAEQS